MRWMGAALALATLAMGGCKRRNTAGASTVSRSTAAHAVIDTSLGHAPPGVRIKVEVLNASRNRGVARRATLYLRDHGFDVVAIGTTRQQQSATVVLDRSHHPEWAALIAQAIGADVAARPDTSRYVDATVLLGADWTPPPMPFYP